MFCNNCTRPCRAYGAYCWRCTLRWYAYEWFFYWLRKRQGQHQ